MTTYFDNLGSFTIMDNISTNAILARDDNGPIMNYKYVTTRDDVFTLFWSSGNSTPNIKWGLIDFENFNNSNYLNNDILCKIGQPNTFYSFGSFCVLITCLNGGRIGIPIMSGVKPVSPITNSKNWLLSNNVIYGNTDMNLIPNKNIMIYLEDTNTYYSLRFSIWQAGGGGRIAYTRTLSSSPTITNFSIPTKIYGNAPFQITQQPTSNSSGSFSYTSSVPSVATISGNTITIVGAGTSTITATQAATNNYTSGTITTTFQVNQSTPTNPVIINNNNELLYFMSTSSNYANITNNLEINYDLITSSYKLLTGNNIKIIKSNN